MQYESDVRRVGVERGVLDAECDLDGPHDLPEVSRPGEWCERELNGQYAQVDAWRDEQCRRAALMIRVEEEVREFLNYQSLSLDEQVRYCQRLVNLVRCRCHLHHLLRRRRRLFC